jgi:glutamate transport system permease protein
MTGSRLLTQVILPQAVRSMAQPLGTLFIGVVLSTSLAAVVGVPELTGASAADDSATR